MLEQTKTIGYMISDYIMVYMWVSILNTPSSIDEANKTSVFYRRVYSVPDMFFISYFYCSFLTKNLWTFCCAIFQFTLIVVCRRYKRGLDRKVWNTLNKLAINIYTMIRRNDKILRRKKGESKPIDRKQADREPGQIKRGHVNAFICRCMVLSRKISPPRVSSSGATGNCFRRKFA